MKRGLWLLMFFLLAGHVPAASADSACEGRFVNPITDICWSCIFPLSLGSIKVSQGKVPDTANPSMPIQICPAPPPLFRRIGLAIGYWEPMALTDVTRSPGCMVTAFTGGNGCCRFYGADGYRSADVRREKRCEISRWCYSLPEYPASRRE